MVIVHEVNINIYFSDVRSLAGTIHNTEDVFLPNWLKECTYLKLTAISMAMYRKVLLCPRGTPAVSI